VYAGGDPVNHTDPTGLDPSAVPDLIFIALDLHNLFTGGRKDLGENLAALGLDVLGLMIPIVTGLGAGGRHLGEVDDLFDFSKGIRGADNVPPIKSGSIVGETSGRAFPGSIRRQALTENPRTCVYCHLETDAPQVDHAIPRSRGGNATIDNAQTTCGWCNASKGARDFPVNPPPGYRGFWPPSWWPE
jgi:hypothetical protein